MQVKKQQLEAAIEQRLIQNWESTTVRLYMSPCLFTFCAEHTMHNVGLDEAEDGI